MMDREAQRREVDANYDYFHRKLGEILPNHIGQFAVLKSREIIEFFDTPAEAYRFGLHSYGTQGFSIQEVTEEPIDLGFFSHVSS
jgi:hypothetical protein